MTNTNKYEILMNLSIVFFIIFFLTGLFFVAQYRYRYKKDIFKGFSDSSKRKLFGIQFGKSIGAFLTLGVAILLSSTILILGSSEPNRFKICYITMTFPLILFAKNWRASKSLKYRFLLALFFLFYLFFAIGSLEIPERIGLFIVGLLITSIFLSLSLYHVLYFNSISSSKD